MKVRGQSWLAVFFCVAVALHAATNSGQLDESLVLSPPRAELPPTVWEQSGVWIVAGAVVVLVLIAGVVWLLLRPGATVAMPIEIQTRRELEALRKQSEDGKVLSQVSRSLRRYVTGAFDLPPEELTTTEFCRAIAAHEKISAELAARVAEFLRQCDELKFSPSAQAAPIGAAARALELVELGEARRAWLRQQSATADVNQPARA